MTPKTYDVQPGHCGYCCGKLGILDLHGIHGNRYTCLENLQYIVDIQHGNLEMEDKAIDELLHHLDTVKEFVATETDLEKIRAFINEIAERDL